MEDIIQELKAKAQNVPVPLDLPSDDDLLDVEEALLLPLPRDYRIFLSEVSDLILGSLEPATAADPNSHTYLPEIAATAWAEGLPRHLIPICITPEVTYALAPDGEIQSWTQARCLEQAWENIWEWSRDVWLTSATG